MTDERDITPESVTRAFAEGAAAVARASDLDAALVRLLALAVQATGASAGAFLLQDPDLASLQLAVSTGLDEAARERLAADLSDERGPLGVAFRDRLPITVGAADASGGALLAGIGAAELTLRPLIVERDAIEACLGVRALSWTESGRAETADGFLGAIADLAAVGIDRAKLASLAAERSEWFERMAHTDPLTGLANHRTFARVLELELARASRQGGEVSVAVFDVDHFTATNDAAGHEAGDDVLRMVAAVLAESVRLVDTVARYGGDEFVLVAPGSAGITVAQRVLDGIARLAPVDGRRITVSAGVARFPSDGASADELLASAEAALATAQGSGPGGLAEARFAAS